MLGLNLTLNFLYFSIVTHLLFIPSENAWNNIITLFFISKCRIKGNFLSNVSAQESNPPLLETSDQVDKSSVVSSLIVIVITPEL